MKKISDHISQSQQARPVPEWLDGMEDQVFSFLESVSKPERPGKYLPCIRGATKYGERAELGLSCFALRIHYALGQWEKIGKKKRKSWVGFIQDFQTNEDDQNIACSGAYVDAALVAYLRKESIWRSFNRIRHTSVSEILRNRSRTDGLKPFEKAIIAETKQVISTLWALEVATIKPYQNFPSSSDSVRAYLNSFDWSLPWGAGGQTASLAVFLETEAPRFLDTNIIENLKQEMKKFYRFLADPESGAYFQHREPNHGSLVNGAMKVLTALDWLAEPIHYPENLIDTVLAKMPKADGCHLVDAVYVLYRCSLRTQHRRTDVEAFLYDCLWMIRSHQQVDGGFSYSRNQAQKWYYGLPVSKGLKESDVHGTFLLVWALTMIVSILWPGKFSWNVIRP